MKTQHKIAAQALRRRGVSLYDISDSFGISKSTASLWTSDVELSELGKERIKTKAIRDRYKSVEVSKSRRIKRIEVAEKRADELVREIERTSTLDLIVLSMIYQCEGVKSDQHVRFTNSDPSMIRTFLAVLRNSFKIDEKRLRVNLQLHDYHDKNEIMNFWSGVTGVPLDQFHRPYMKASEHIYRKDGYKGCVHIHYDDAHIARILLSFAKKLYKLYI